AGPGRDAGGGPSLGRGRRRRHGAAVAQPRRHPRGAGRRRPRPRRPHPRRAGKAPARGRRRDVVALRAPLPVGLGRGADARVRLARTRRHGPAVPLRLPRRAGRDDAAAGLTGRLSATPAPAPNRPRRAAPPTPGRRSGSLRSPRSVALGDPPAALVLAVALLHGAPGDLVGDLLAGGVAAPLLGLVVLLPGAVEGLLVDLLRVLRKVVLAAVGELADPGVRHGRHLLVRRPAKGASVSRCSGAARCEACDADVAPSGLRSTG